MAVHLFLFHIYIYILRESLGLSSRVYLVVPVQFCCKGMPAIVTCCADNLLQALTDIPKPERKPQAPRDGAHQYWEE